MADQITIAFTLTLRGDGVQADFTVTGVDASPDKLLGKHAVSLCEDLGRETEDRCPCECCVQRRMYLRRAAAELRRAIDSKVDRLAFIDQDAPAKAPLN